MRFTWMSEFQTDLNLFKFKHVSKKKLKKKLLKFWLKKSNNNYVGMIATLNYGNERRKVSYTQVKNWGKW